MRRCAALRGSGQCAISRKVRGRGGAEARAALRGGRAAPKARSPRRREGPRGGGVRVGTPPSLPPGPAAAFPVRTARGAPPPAWRLRGAGAGARGPGEWPRRPPYRPALQVSAHPVPPASRAPGAHRPHPARPSAECTDPGAPSCWGCCLCWGRRGPAGAARSPGRPRTDRRCCGSSWRSSRSSGSTTRGSPRGCSSRAGRTTPWTAGRSRTTLTQRSREWVSPRPPAVEASAACKGLQLVGLAEPPGLPVWYQGTLEEPGLAWR